MSFWKEILPCVNSRVLYPYTVYGILTGRSQTLADAIEATVKNLKKFIFVLFSGLLSMYE